MPIYEYECESCHHYLDVLQKLSDDPLTFCPECGEPRLRKLVSAPSFRLKGGGWYETDFKKDNQRNLAEGSGSSDKPASKEKPTAGESGSTAKSTDSGTSGKTAASTGGGSAGSSGSGGAD